jgi:hypothetical protein
MRVSPDVYNKINLYTDCSLVITLYWVWDKIALLNLKQFCLCYTAVTLTSVFGSCQMLWFFKRVYFLLPAEKAKKDPKYPDRGQCTPYWLVPRVPLLFHITLKRTGGLLFKFTRTYSYTFVIVNPWRWHLGAETFIGHMYVLCILHHEVHLLENIQI